MGGKQHKGTTSTNSLLLSAFHRKNTPQNFDDLQLKVGVLASKNAFGNPLLDDKAKRGKAKKKSEGGLLDTISPRHTFTDLLGEICYGSAIKGSDGNKQAQKEILSPEEKAGIIAAAVQEAVKVLSSPSPGSNEKAIALLDAALASVGEQGSKDAPTQEIKQDAQGAQAVSGEKRKAGRTPPPEAYFGDMGGF